MMTRHFLILFILLICACTTPPTEALPPTATTVRVVAATLVPTLDRHAQALPTASPLPTFTPRPENCPPVTGQSAAQHSVVANLNYVERGLAVAQTTRYSNRTNENLTDLVFTIEANGWPGAFTLDTLELDGADVTYELTGRRLHIELPQALLPGCFVTVEARFRLIVPEIGGGISGYRGFLGHSPRQLNLGNWLLAVAPHLDGEWITREAVLIGEQTVFDAADWEVTVNVNGAVENLQIAAPGTADRSGERSWHFSLERSRDFTLSISDQFNVLREETPGGVTVEVYSFDDARIAAEGGVVVDAAAYALEVAINSVSRYSDLYGAYPYSRLVIVQGDFPDGMEFSGLVFVSRDWFTRFTGNPASYLMLITAHEIAHQWWYAAVGSDQAQYRCV